MNTKTSLELTHDLFQVIKQLPRIRLTQTTSGEIKGREYDLLTFLALNQDPDTRALTVTQISGLLHITPAGVTHLLNSLEEAECIKRTRHPDDRRVVLIGLTDKGQGIAQQMIAQVQGKLIGLVEHMGEAETETLVTLMNKMIAYLSED